MRLTKLPVTSRTAIKTLHRAAAVFLIALSARAALIAFTPNMTRSLDLCIYSSAGELVSRGVDPYDFADGRGIRSELRAHVCSTWFSETQQRWDYYVSTNLPLSMLMYGAIDGLFPGRPIAFRIVFALFDAVLAALIVEFLFSVWKLEQTLANYLLAFGLAAFSLTFLWWGTVVPEDKGIQTLLMLAALFTARRHKLVASALLLGASIAFKGLGVFLAPLCLWYIARSGPVHEGSKKNDPVRRVLVYSGLVAVVVGFCFAPFMPQLLEMMRHRLATNLSAVEPGHGSIWRPVFYLAGDWWSMLKTLSIASFVVMHAYLWRRHRLSAEVATASVLILFVDVALLGGSMDRMNIGLVIAMLLIGITDPVAGVRLGWFYVVGGAVVTAATVFVLKTHMADDGEILDGNFVLVFVLYFVHLVWKVRGGRVREHLLR